jgi:hypothetical protein
MAEKKEKEPEVPSYAGKTFEEMTPKEREQYQKDRAARFTWEEGDLEYIGNEPLTEEEKKLVKEIEKAREEAQKK